MNVKLDTTKSAKSTNVDSFSMINTNFERVYIIKSAVLKINILRIKSKGFRILSRYLLIKEYQPQKAIKSTVAILEGIMISDRIEEEI